MLAIPRRIHGVHHPLIDELYIKKEYHGQTPAEKVLIIETNDLALRDNKNESNNPLLADLKDLEEQVRAEGEDFNRVDIRTAVIDTPNTSAAIQTRNF